MNVVRSPDVLSLRVPHPALPREVAVPNGFDFPIPTARQDLKTFRASGKRKTVITVHLGNDFS